jgi:hypothetical protein
MSMSREVDRLGGYSSSVQLPEPSLHLCRRVRHPGSYVMLLRIGTRLDCAPAPAAIFVSCVTGKLQVLADPLLPICAFLSVGLVSLVFPAERASKMTPD